MCLRRSNSAFPEFFLKETIPAQQRYFCSKPVSLDNLDQLIVKVENIWVAFYEHNLQLKTRKNKIIDYSPLQRYCILTMNVVLWSLM